MFALNLAVGTIEIPLKSVWLILWGEDNQQEIWRNIVIRSRLPQALTATVAGAGLAVSGMQMQTVFRNPLAGPSVLGVSSGATLGVGFVVLLSGSLGGVALSRLGYLGDAAMSVAAIIGAMAVLSLIVWVSHKVKGNVTLLVIGVMIGYLATAIIGVLKFFSNEEDVKAFVVWGLGSFSRVSGDQMLLFVSIMAVLLPLSMTLIKPLNLLLLGDGYARSLGLSIKWARTQVICCSGIFSSYCHSLLRTRHVLRISGASPLPSFISHLRPPYSVTRLCIGRRSFGIVMQLSGPNAWLRRCAASQLSNSSNWCSHRGNGTIRQKQR